MTNQLRGLQSRFRDWLASGLWPALFCMQLAVRCVDAAGALLPRPSAASMFKVRIIPCLDVKDGRVVKGVKFVDLRDAGDPVEAAIAYDAAGADELTFLDITASHENRGIILDVVRRTAEACFMPVTVGGGVRNVEDIRKPSCNPAPTRSRSIPRR